MGPCEQHLFPRDASRRAGAPVVFSGQIAVCALLLLQYGGSMAVVKCIWSAVLLVRGSYLSAIHGLALVVASGPLLMGALVVLVHTPAMYTGSNDGLLIRLVTRGVVSATHLAECSQRAMRRRMVEQAIRDRKMQYARRRMFMLLVGAIFALAGLRSSALLIAGGGLVLSGLVSGCCCQLIWLYSEHARARVVLTALAREIEVFTTLADRERELAPVCQDGNIA